MKEAFARRIIRGSIAIGPSSLLAAFLLFPYLGRWSFQTFHLACIFCLLTALVGIVLWLVQFFTVRRRSDFVSLSLLLACAVCAVLAIIYGDWYWAFSRGYFLE